MENRVRAVVAQVLWCSRWLSALAAAGFNVAPLDARAATLPVPCVAGACGTTTGGAPVSWVTAGNATATATANSLNITQTTDHAILNWSSFNISADGQVIFNQPAKTSIALNQIFQASPSQIFGMLKANGQVYLINQNGFLFGSTARVNTGGLVASSLPLTAGTFDNGLLSAIGNQKAALQSDGRTSVLDASGNPVLGPDGNPLPVQIVVQQGAQISTNDDNERIILAAQGVPASAAAPGAPGVSNSGSISAPGGQVIMASGQAVYLQASTDPRLRGLLVEVDSGGITTNEITGSVDVQEGNITLIGLAVNQNGRLSATTSVSQDGSIRLLGRDVGGPDNIGPTNTGVFSGSIVEPNEGGDVTLGPQSRTTVTPDTVSTATAVDATAQLPSIIDIEAQHAVFQEGSQTTAPGGQIAVIARSDPWLPPVAAGDQPQSVPADPNAHIRVDPGAVIDVSGATATVPVTENLVTAQLRSNELADSPLQQNGPLQGSTVIVDARADNGLGTPVANVTGYIGLIQRSVLERLDKGGSVLFDSSGDVVVANSATVNVSGGAINYTGGQIQTTQLVKPDGTLVDIGQASPDQLYKGILNPTVTSVVSTWGVTTTIPTPGLGYYQPGYVQGASAGSITVLGSSMLLNGNFVGQAVNGPYQRSGSSVASGGTFFVGMPAAAGLNTDFRAPPVELTASPPPIAVDDSHNIPSGIPLYLSTQLLQNGGFSNIQIASNESITLAPQSPLHLSPGGNFLLEAPRVEVDSSVSIAGGTIDIQTGQSVAVGLTAPGQGLGVGNGVSLDVSGLWTNDHILPLGTLPTGYDVINAGQVQLTQGTAGGDFDIGSNVSLIANGGAWLQQSGALSGGTGGSISILSQGSTHSTFEVGDNLTVQGFGVQGAAGGSFALQVPRVAIAAGSGSWLQAQSIAFDAPASSDSSGTPDGGTPGSGNTGSGSTGSGDTKSGGTLAIGNTVFSSFGFSNFTITADGPGLTDGSKLAANPAGPGAALTIAPGTAINLQTPTLLLNANADLQSSSDSATSVASTGLLPAYQRTGSTLNLAVAPNALLGGGMHGGLVVGAGVEVTGDPRSALNLTSLGGIEFDGAAKLPAGSVTMKIPSPSGALDQGYDPLLTLELGPRALIDVSGTAIYQPSDSGVLAGQVLGGGTVTLDADRGSVLTDSGSSIDFSGTQALMDIATGTSGTGTARQTVASGAGALVVHAADSIALLGDYRGMAGVGTTGPANGGTLSVTLVAPTITIATGQTPYPTAPRTVEIAPASTVTGNQLPYGLAVVDAGALARSGIDALNVTADDEIQIDAGTALTLGRSVTLAAPAIAMTGKGSASVTAPYIALGTGPNNDNAATASSGLGQVEFAATSMDLEGTLAFQGVSQAMLSATGTIQLLGDTNTGEPTTTGSLSIAGDLTMAASRIVPGTSVSYSITAAGGSSNTVTFQQTGSSAEVPLSAGGSLSVTAQNITQGGTLWAPFGEISLNASDSLTLAPGSLTSVSGAGALIPYGRVDNGSSWVYDPNPTLVTPTSVNGIPARQVSLNGSSVNMAAGATVDVSGGGDLAAYQWTPGTGGTKDVLSPAQSPGLYAIIPSLQGQAGPYDPFLWSQADLQQANLQQGATVYLSAGAGVPAGYYTLLPARYALLQGAYLVSQVSGFQDLQPGQSAGTGNGGAVVAGYFSYMNTGVNLGVGAGGSSRFTGFLVEPSSYTAKIGTYTENTATAFFAPAAGTTAVPGSRPADGGILELAAQQSLTAAGSVLTKAAQGGDNATVEVSATQLEVDPTTSNTPAQGSVQLAASVVQGWDPGRLLLGGHLNSDGSLQVDADSVHVTGGSSLDLSDILITARNSIAVDSGAKIATPSATDSSIKPAAATADPTTLQLSGDGAGSAALLIVSDVSYYVPDRSEATAGATAGTININAGASVGSGGALALDAPGAVAVADGTIAGVGARWSLGSSHIVVGQNDGAVADGLGLDASLLSSLNAAGSIRLASAGAIDLDGAITLGSSTSTSELDLLASSLNNLTSGSTSSFGAAHIVLGGPSGAAGVPTSGQGTVSFTGQEIDLGPGNLTLSGFDHVALNSTGVLYGQGAGGLTTSGDLAITASSLITATGAHTAISAPSGAVTLTSVSPGSTTAPTAGLGGTLTLTAATINDQLPILMPSGGVTLNAGTALTLGTGASIDVSGLLPSGADMGTGGGAIALNSGGTVNVAAGVLLNVSAATGADAGQILVTATGAAALDGTLLAKSDAGATGGTFSITAGSLDDFSALNRGLESNGFSEERDFRVTAGDLDVGASDQITAHHVELTADSGSINIAGTINASGPGERGSIDIASHGDLTLASTAQLLANGGDSNTRGGQVVLATTGGTLNVATQATVEATGTDSSGELILRAPINSSGSDAAISTLPTDLSRVDSVVLEPIYALTLSGSPSASDLDTAEAEVAQSMSTAAPALSSRLGVAIGTNVAVRPYVDFTITGDLALPAIDFSDPSNPWRFNGQPADVAFRATGNITVSGTLSDGFQGIGTTLAPLASGQSAGMSLVAGADLSSASSTAVVTGAAADLTLADGAIVRTGTGDIALVAARNISFGDGAGVYTGGIASATAFNRAGVRFSYPTGGGDIQVRAGQDIISTPPDVPKAIDTWQTVKPIPSGAGKGEATWGINFSQFNWNVGTLGGGDVSITAGNDIHDLSAATADSAVFDSTAGGLQYLGGGNLRVTARGDIASNLLYVSRGTGTIQAGGSITSDRTFINGADQAPLDTLLVAGDASYSVTARNDVSLLSLLQEFALYPQVTAAGVTGFVRYSATSQLSVGSFGGNVTFDSSLTNGVVSYIGDAAVSGSAGSLPIMPASLRAAAFGGDLTLGAPIEMVPSASGQLDLYATRDVGIDATVIMSDAASALVSTATAPHDGGFTDVIPFIDNGIPYSQAIIHAGDTQPVRVIAGRDITGGQAGSLNLPKAAVITAGRDVTNLGINVQNTSASDVTLVQAGRDIIYSPDASTDGMTIDGPGAVDLIAGRNVNLGLSAGIVTLGNIKNPALPSGGAAINVVAGLGAALGINRDPTSSAPDFVSSIIEPSTEYADDLIQYVEQLSGQSGLTLANAAQDFRALPLTEELPLLESVFFAELGKSGVEANEVPSLGYTRGYNAIDSLFPGSRSTTSSYTGNLELAFSQINTQAGGTISLLVPGGIVDVGLANPPPTLAARPASTLGIVAVGPGDVDIFSESDVNVNASRVFTLGGGNITVWSTLGNIDAGRGAKTAISAPPPTLTVDANGNVNLDFSNSVAGSGIRTIITGPDVPAGDVNLIAPAGFVNAGDAGIGAAGNLNIAAQRVLGLDNIQVGGLSTGVPPSTSNIGLSVSSANNASSSTTTAATSSINERNAENQTAPLAQTALGWLEVFVEGFGSDVCKESDAECMKRQAEQKH